VFAVLAAGYADGLPHRLSNKGKVIAGGKPAPILGAVSMDVTTIDISESPELRPGDTVTLLGAEGAGLSEATHRAADLRVRIAMAPGVDSLNVATACAIALHRLTDLARPADAGSMMDGDPS